MIRSRVLLALELVLVPVSAAFAVDADVVLVGVWPNRVRLFDVATRTFIDEFQTNRGVVVMDSRGFTQTSRTPDSRRIYFITDQMESVEVVDPARQTVIDTIKLSTPGRRVRIFGVAPMENGGKLYITIRAVREENDRFLPETDVDVVVFDVDTREIESEFRFPDRVESRDRPPLLPTPDGRGLFALGQDIYEISTASHEVVDTIVLSRPRAPGYGPVGGGPTFVQTGRFDYYGVYQTSDPIVGKRMTGIVHFDAAEKRVERFEVGPSMEVSYVALNADGTRAYLGGMEIAAVDLRERKVLRRRKGVDRGRSHTSWIVSPDGSELLASGVGDTMRIYDTETLELVDSVYLGGDAMFAPFALPAEATEKQPSQ